MIAVDWGTSSLRAYRLDAQGRVLESRSEPKGIVHVSAGGFPATLEAFVGDWIGAGESNIAMSGMVGSRQGWKEVPYVHCPAGLAEVRSHLIEVAWKDRKAWIAPGLSCIDEDGVPDVMRGEETQLLGAMDSLPGEALVCLPGTHSKWAWVREQKVASFRTYFTGEAFGLLRSYSLLGRTMQEGPRDESAFGEGVARSGEPGGLLHHLFGVRTRALFGELSGSDSASYLSGILVGHELRSAGGGAGKFFLLGEESLTAAYALAARLLGIEAQVLDSLAAARGLFLLSRG